MTTLAQSLAAFDRHATRHTLDTGRYRMRYVRWGEGPGLVIIHGMADAARSFAPLMHRLRDRFACVAYELPGGAGDGAALRRYTHADHAADLFALLDHLGLGRVAVLGSSFGSTVALAALAANPERFTHGVLQGGFARRPLTRAERLLARLGRFLPGRFGDWPRIRRKAMAKFDGPAFAAAPPEVYEFFLENSGRTPLRTAARRGLLIDRLDLRPLLPQVRTPVLMIGGDRDAIVLRIHEAEVEAGLKDVRRVEFTPCGHYPQYTHPGAMADEIRRFLGEPGA
jgi:pimeloyl-ACP methyl ester carboxylesterase